MPELRRGRGARNALARKIAQFRNDNSGERNLYPLVRDLLVTPAFGIGLKADQVVVDSALARSRDIPDLTVFSTREGRPLKTPDHAYGVFEVKRGRDVSENVAAIYEDKKKYVKAGTRWFFILDQEEVHKWDVMAKTEASVYRWEHLSDAERFRACFAELRPEHVALEEQLKEFRDGKTRYAFQSIDDLGRHHFTDTIREIAAILSDAVMQLVDTKVAPDLTSARALLQAMEERWGAAVYDWNSMRFPIEFTNIVDAEIAGTLSSEDIAEYPEAHDRFAADLEPYVYALRIEAQLLDEYAGRMGIDGDISLLKPRRAGSKLTDSGKVVESFTYETASLIVSRMLMVRFSEDHGFLKRYISNGGVEVFARYADYYSKPMQALLKETYRQSAELYRSLFDRNLLDWALDSTDENLSAALLHAMYLLSRWDFRAIHGDILSGVYDHYLDPGKRRALGEVFTRPEIARYMLAGCGYDSTKTVLDPACGTGTFLVEALNQDVKRLRAAGMLTEQTVTRTLRRLYGLDISPFSVSLAQIQLLWHNIDLFAGKSPAEIRSLAAELVPAIQVQGGHSSLDTLGVPLVKGVTRASQTGLDFATVVSDQRRKRVASVSRRFRQVVQGTYDIVIGNPPFVRPHRLTLDDATWRAYEEVARGQFDLYIPFLYRAVRGWVKEGGRVSFILPMGVLEASYASPLRRVLKAFKLVEVVDLEALRKKTFRGVKRPTIIFVLEKSPGSEDDEVVTTTLSMGSYDADTDTIDFSKADKDVVERRLISESAYLPERVDDAPWMTDVLAESGSALLTKVSAADASILQRMARAPRLGDIVKVVYKRRGDRKTGTAQANAVAVIPAGGNPREWEPYVMLAYGIKLGSSQAIVRSGLPIYKGQNIFPSGTLGEPMGYWDPERSKTDSLRLFAYRHLFDYSKLYAVRNVSQLPAACPAPADRVFQNTAQLVQLSEEFPLNLYLLSRVPQWFAVKLLRTSVIEDLFTTWVKRNLLLIPIPPRRTPADVSRLQAAGEILVTKDKDLANAHRHVEQVVADSPKKSLFDLFAQNSPLVADADLGGAASGAVVTAVQEEGEDVVSDNRLFRIRVPNPVLRRYLAYRLERVLDEGVDVTFDVETLGGVQIPHDLEGAVAAIDLMHASDPVRMFEDALLELDRVVAHLFGMSAADLDYITSAMMNDGFLKQLRPIVEHRGLRIQPYADHSQGDRYM